MSESDETALVRSEYRTAIQLRDSVNLLVVYATWGVAAILLAVGVPPAACIGLVPSVFGVFSVARTYRERRRAKRAKNLRRA